MTPFAASSIPLAGVFILWLGWFGFNSGSLAAGHLKMFPQLLQFTLILAAAGGGVLAANYF